MGRQVEETLCQDRGKGRVLRKEGKSGCKCQMCFICFSSSAGRQSVRSGGWEVGGILWSLQGAELRGSWFCETREPLSR